MHRFLTLEQNDARASYRARALSAAGNRVKSCGRAVESADLNKCRFHRASVSSRSSVRSAEQVRDVYMARTLHMSVQPIQNVATTHLCRTSSVPTSQVVALERPKTPAQLYKFNESTLDAVNATHLGSHDNLMLLELGPVQTTSSKLCSTRLHGTSRIVLV